MTLFKRAMLEMRYTLSLRNHPVGVALWTLLLGRSP